MAAISRDEVETHGYAVIKLLDEKTVSEIREYFDGLGISDIKGNYCSIHEENSDLKVGISSFLTPILQSRLEAQGWDGHTVMGGVFVVKAPTEDHVEPHQDPTLVDESRWRSMNVWIPLQDVNTENGCLWILPTSQSEGPLCRPGNGYDHPSFYDRVPKDAIWDSLVPIEMSAGEALIYDHRMLHASRGNGTERNRLAVVSALRADDAELRFYNSQLEDGQHVLAEYSMGSSDYFSFVDFVPTTGTLINRSIVEPSYISPAQFQERFGQGSDGKSGQLQKLTSKISAGFRSLKERPRVGAP